MGLLNNLGNQAIGTGMGIVTGGMERENQLEQNQAMIDQQTKAGKAMAMFNNQQAMKMWRDTNHKAQVAEMKKAGLNVGLMYGGAGGGGGASSAPASAPQGGAGDRNDIMGGMGLMLQTQNMQAQKELIEAQRDNTKEDTVTKELGNKWEKFLQDFDGNEGTDGTPLKEREKRVDLNEKEARILNLDWAAKKMKTEIEKIGIDMNKGNAEIKRIVADEKLMNQLQKYREEMNPLEVEQLKREMEVYKNNPANNEIVQWIRAILGMGGDIKNIAK